MRHVARLLRKMGMSYQKPYVTDLKRPEDAEEILKKIDASRALEGGRFRVPRRIVPLSQREYCAPVVIWYAETAEEYREEGAGELICSGF